MTKKDEKYYKTQNTNVMKIEKTNVVLFNSKLSALTFSSTKINPSNTTGIVPFWHPPPFLPYSPAPFFTYRD